MYFCIGNAVKYIYIVQEINNNSGSPIHFAHRKKEKKVFSQLRNVEFILMKRHTVKSAVAQLPLARSTHQ